MVLKRPHMKLIWGVPCATWESPSYVTNVTTLRWLIKARTSRHMSCPTLSKGGILHPPHPRNALWSLDPTWWQHPQLVKPCSVPDLTLWLAPRAESSALSPTSRTFYVAVQTTPQCHHAHISARSSNSCLKAGLWTGSHSVTKSGVQRWQPSLLPVTATGLSERAGKDKNPWKS